MQQKAATLSAVELTPGLAKRQQSKQSQERLEQNLADRKKALDKIPSVEEMRAKKQK